MNLAASPCIGGRTKSRPVRGETVDGRRRPLPGPARRGPRGRHRTIAVVDRRRDARPADEPCGGAFIALGFATSDRCTSSGNGQVARRTLRGIRVRSSPVAEAPAGRLDEDTGLRSRVGARSIHALGKSQCLGFACLCRDGLGGPAIFVGGCEVPVAVPIEANAGDVPGPSRRVAARTNSRRISSKLRGSAPPGR